MCQETSDLAEGERAESFSAGIVGGSSFSACGLTLPYHNGGTEGVNTETKRIMRQADGRASSPCCVTESCSDDRLP